MTDLDLNRTLGPMAGISSQADSFSASLMGSKNFLRSVPAEGDVTKSIDDGMNTDESHRGSEASHSPPPSPTLRQAASDEPTRHISDFIPVLKGKSRRGCDTIGPRTYGP